MALLLAARRQQTAEYDLATKQHDLLLREQANEDLRHDAAERRITELYLKSVEQLGSEHAPVRLAGLYALDRLAQDNPSQRQTIVNVVAAYLRMPYSLAVDQLANAGSGEYGEEYRRQMQEREVRLTAQRIMTGHLSPQVDASRYWEGINLDLSGAFLIDFNLENCNVENARFVNARFYGDVFLTGAEFVGETRFDGALFDAYAWFSEANFSGVTRFDGSIFCGEARFEKTSFRGGTVFRQASFRSNCRFDDAVFAGSAVFGGAVFARNANFGGASFMDDAWLAGVEFSREAFFDRVKFAGDAWFSQAVFSSYTVFDDANFAGDIKFAGATLDGMPYRPDQRDPDDMLSFGS
ncbi:pentapeptide repeat-containing protein [Amycolatopsis suaedae]|uniref:pentapeptide repeat-containing protein n=1 Tax=Amycolatopsis suaedae TaxID=2510978 RepID=UPI001F0E7C92|nr:pentapeptide repeat-containing protein [Amycolatopsis suaedae]